MLDGIRLYEPLKGLTEQDSQTRSISVGLALRFQPSLINGVSKNLHGVP